MAERKIMRLGESTPSVSMIELQDTVSGCMQCGTCSGSCPVVWAMDHTPRAIMRMISAGLEEQMLSSNTMWVCASCYLCAVRCPRDIEVTDVMGDLRHMALKAGYLPKADVAYCRDFVKIVRSHGRMWEPELMVRFGLSVNPLSLLSQIPIGLALLRRGKLAFSPTRIEGLKEVREIYDHLEEAPDAEGGVE